MKSIERAKAVVLRKEGFSVREIARETHCAKSSISTWVRGIPLTVEQIRRLDSNQDKGRAKAASHPNSPKCVWGRLRQEIKDSAAKEVSKEYSSGMLKILGASLYWAEGYKRSENMVNFTNSDPAMIALMMKFFRNICKVPEDKFRGGVHIHPHLDREAAVRFWMKVSGIPVKQFHRTQLCVSKASKHKMDTLPLGTFSIIICDVRLQSRIKGWIKGIEKWSDLGAISSVG
jgi:hypothetical protein